MSPAKPDTHELTYPLRTAARLTGLSPELIRAWEGRHGVVTPQRTPGGTRRYTAADLERLQLVKAAVDAGHRIGQVAHLSNAELAERAARPDAGDGAAIEDILQALDALDVVEAHRLLSMRFLAVGPVRFAHELALPLVREIGNRWAGHDLGIASEHLGSAVLRSMFGSSLLPDAAARMGPKVVFGTPAGERHELGLQMAALTAMGAGANPVYLGSELPVEDFLSAAEKTGAAAVGLSVVTLPVDAANRTVAALRGGLPGSVHLWVGGARASDLARIGGVECIDSLDALEQRVALLVTAARGPGR
jgi:DNA-binding transcriptional MerR regulator/methylmalonyl-CoA mutase cobalamin-binding subunit